MYFKNLCSVVHGHIGGVRHGPLLAAAVFQHPHTAEGPVAVWPLCLSSTGLPHPPLEGGSSPRPHHPRSSRVGQHGNRSKIPIRAVSSKQTNQRTNKQKNTASKKKKKKKKASEPTQNKQASKQTIKQSKKRKVEQ